MKTILKPAPKYNPDQVNPFILLDGQPTMEANKQYGKEILYKQGFSFKSAEPHEMCYYFVNHETKQEAILFKAWHEIEACGVWLLQYN